MRIGIAGNILNKNRRGFEIYLRHLITHLNCIPDCKIVLYLDRPSDDFNHLENVSVRLVTNNVKTFVWRNIFLPYHAFKDKIDVMHFPDNNTWFIQWKPTVVTLHDIAPIICKTHRITTGWMLFIIRIIYFFIKRTARKIITVSRSSKMDIERYLATPAGKVVAIHNGWDDKGFHVIPKDEAYRKISSIVDPNDQFILFVGGIDRRKNVTAIVQAVDIVRKRWKKDIKLVISGEYKKIKGIPYTLRSEIFYDPSVREYVKLAGYTDKETLIALYNAASLFVLPSFYEGFGIPVIEAMSCATPVVVSESLWGHEVTGDNALFFDPYDVVDIAEKMLVALRNTKLSEKFRKKGLLHVKNFSWHNTAHKTYEVYKQAVRNKAKQ
ncbi:MAG: glycosyltransferase family 1 protein [Candidatus Auribacterota bacterium]|jgi:glycosyltransferase involved in cell wall biosynthesis|nr:glycosyltransferase family 1 protein [Candidatus Auribacterota bacterium]